MNKELLRVSKIASVIDKQKETISPEFDILVLLPLEDKDAISEEITKTTNGKVNDMDALSILGCTVYWTPNIPTGNMIVSFVDSSKIPR